MNFIVDHASVRQINNLRAKNDDLVGSVKELVGAVTARHV